MILRFVWVWMVNDMCALRRDTIYDIDNDELQFIWGMKAPDNITGEYCELYTTNDIEIAYYGKKDIYILLIETAYIFKNKSHELEYLEWLLKVFTDFMDINAYDKNYEYDLFMSDVRTINETQSIPELYVNFKIFVEGYRATYKECNNE